MAALAPLDYRVQQADDNKNTLLCTGGTLLIIGLVGIFITNAVGLKVISGNASLFSKISLGFGAGFALGSIIVLIANRDTSDTSYPAIFASIIVIISLVLVLLSALAISNICSHEALRYASVIALAPFVFSAVVFVCGAKGGELLCRAIC